MPRALCLITLVLCMSFVGCNRGSNASDQIAAMQLQTATLKAQLDSDLKAKGCTLDNHSSGWSVEQCKSKMDSAKSVTISKLNGEAAGLFVRCDKGRNTEAFVSLNTQIEKEHGTDLHKVRVKVDDGRPSAQHWSASTDGRGLFSPNPREFASQLARARTLYFEYTPFEERERVVEFDLSGLSEVLTNVSDACNWKADDVLRKAAEARKKTEKDARDAKIANNCEHLEFSCTTIHVESDCIAYHAQCKQ